VIFVPYGRTVGSRGRLLAVAIVVATTFPAFAACMFTAEPPISDVGPGGTLSFTGGGSDSGADVSADVGIDVTADVAVEVSADVGVDVSADVSVDVSADVGFDVSADAGADVDAGVSCFGATGACNNLVLCGMQTAELYSAGAPAPPTGGAITPGVYVLTSYIAYDETGDAGGVWRNETLQIAALASDEGGAGVSYSFNRLFETDLAGPFGNSGALDVEGPALTFEQTCQVSSVTKTTYTATPTSLTIYETPGEFPTEFDYALMQ
jgi:hypothetical protein